MAKRVSPPQKGRVNPPEGRRVNPPEGRRLNPPGRTSFEELPKYQQLWLANLEPQAHLNNEVLLEDGCGTPFYREAVYLYAHGWGAPDSAGRNVIQGLVAQGAIGIRDNVPVAALKALGIERGVLK